MTGKRDFLIVIQGATTNYKVQGLEAENVIYHADTRKQVSYNSFYVAASRAKCDLQVYTNDKPEFLNQVQQEEKKTSTLDYDLAATKNKGLALQLSLEPTSS